MSKYYKLMILPLFISYQTVAITLASEQTLASEAIGNTVASAKGTSHSSVEKGSITVRKTNRKKETSDRSVSTGGYDKHSKNESETESSTDQHQPMDSDEFDSIEKTEVAPESVYRVKEDTVEPKKEKKTFLEIENSLGEIEHGSYFKNNESDMTEFGLKLRKLSGSMLCGTPC